MHLHFETIDSTNRYAKEHVKEFSPDTLTCITADEQTAGRGRFQRSWHSPRGVNLYATFYFTLPLETQWTTITQVMAATLATVLQKNGLSPKIKWPNDVQLGGKKVAGILCEAVPREKWIDLFLGVGLNINMSSEALAHIDQPATSLKNETGRDWDREVLRLQLEAQLVQNLATFKKKGFALFRPLIEALLAYKGEKIRCFDGRLVWEGICRSISPEGLLNLELADGTVQTLFAADIKL